MIITSYISYILPGAISISVLFDLILKNLRSLTGSRSRTTDFAWTVMAFTMAVILAVVVLSNVVFVTIPVPATFPFAFHEDTSEAYH